MTNLAMDYLGLDAAVGCGDRLAGHCSEFVRDRIRPHISAWYEKAVLPPRSSRWGGLGCSSTPPSGTAAPATAPWSMAWPALELEAADSGPPDLRQRSKAASLDILPRLKAGDSSYPRPVKEASS